MYDLKTEIGTALSYTTEREREREREVYLRSDGTYTILWTDRSSKTVHGKVHWNKHFRSTIFVISSYVHVSC